jgi:hypothetical protein
MDHFAGDGRPLAFSRLALVEREPTPEGPTMILPLRRAHRWIWLALALLLPALYLAALALRPAPPRLDRLPAALEPFASPGGP